MPLVRSDGLPTQHMRALAYWSAAPELDDVDLAPGLRQRVGRPRHLPPQADRRARARQRQRQRQRQGRRSADPRRLPRHGRPRERPRSPPARKGALLIDDLAEWIEEEIEADPERGRGTARPPAPRSRSPPRSRSATSSCSRRPSGSSSSRRSCCADEKGSLGWDLARAQAHHGAAATAGASGRPRTPTTASRWSSRRSTGATCAARSRSFDVGAARPLPLPLRPLVPGRRSARRRSSAVGPAGARPGHRAASDWRERDEDAAGRQPRFLHLQRLPPAGRRPPARSRWWSTTTPSPGGCSRARTSTRSCSRRGRGSPNAGTTSASAATSSATARSRCSASASATRGSATCSTATSTSAPMAMHGRLSRSATTATASSRTSPQDFSVVRYHSLAITGRWARKATSPPGPTTAW